MRYHTSITAVVVVNIVYQSQTFLKIFGLVLFGEANDKHQIPHLTTKTVNEIATKTHFWLSIKVVTMVLLVYNSLIVIMNPIRKQFAWQKLVFPSQPRVGPPLAIIANDCITTLQSSGIIQLPYCTILVYVISKQKLIVAMQQQVSIFTYIERALDINGIYQHIVLLHSVPKSNK